MAKQMQSADAIAKKWSSGMMAAGPAYLAGIMALTETPGVAAAAAQDRYINGVQKAVADGAYREGNLGYSLASFQQAAKERGAPRLTAVSNQQIAKYTAEIRPVLEHIQSVRSNLPARGDLMQNLQRSQAMALGMATYKKNRR